MTRVISAVANGSKFIYTPTMMRGKFKIARWFAPTHRIKQEIMRYSLALMSIFALFGAIPGRADDVLPPRFNFDRYSAMVKNSPFAIATAVAVPAATPDFAKDLYVANAARSPEGDMVTIASTSDQNFKKYLNTKEPVDGYSIASIEWSDRVGATKVTINKHGKFACAFARSDSAQSKNSPATAYAESRFGTTAESCAVTRVECRTTPSAGRVATGAEAAGAAEAATWEW